MAESVGSTEQRSAAVDGELATYGALFGVGEFRALFVAHIVSMLGTMVAEVALTVLVFQRTHSPALSALTFTVAFLPYLIGGALLGGLVDWWPARRTMVLCDLLAAAFLVTMALPSLPVAALLALNFGAGLAAPIFGGGRAALLPRLLGMGPRYVLGRAMMRTVSQGAQVAGFAVGGVLLVVAGALLAFVARPGRALAMVVLGVVGVGYCHGLALDSLLIATVRESLQARALAVDQAGLMFLQGLGFGAWGGLAELLSLCVTIAVAGACGVAVVLVLVRGLSSYSDADGTAVADDQVDRQ